MSSSKFFWTQQLARWAGLPLPSQSVLQRSTIGALPRLSPHDRPAPTILLWVTASTPLPLPLLAPLFAGFGLHTLSAHGPHLNLDFDELRDAAWFDGRLLLWLWGDLPTTPAAFPTDQFAVLFQTAATAAATPLPLGERSAAHFLTGWDAPALAPTIAEYLRQLALRRRPYLTIAARRSGRFGLLRTALAEGVRWSAAHAGLLPPPTRRPVRCALNNSREWHEMDFWPPPATLRRIPLLPTALRGVWLSPTFEQSCDVIGIPTLHQLSAALPGVDDAAVELAVVTEGQPARILAHGGNRPLPGQDRFAADRIDLSPTAQRLPAGTRLRVTVRPAPICSDRALELTLPLIDAAALARMREWTPTIPSRRRSESVS